MLKKAGLGLLLILAACGGDSNGGGGTGTTACDATTLKAFYDALDVKTMVAVDTDIENGDAGTADTTFTHDSEYDVTFTGSTKTVSIETDTETAELTYDADMGDSFDIAANEINVIMIRGDSTILIQQNCTEDDDSFFISYYSGIGAPVDFFWRLDETE
jgi:hypothetical protein